MKRTLAERVAFLMLSAALAVGAWAVTGRAACSVTAPYQFPVQPGTPEWVELSANARRAACRLPAGLAEQMTSEALLETALDYPFNASMYVSSDLEGMFGKRAALAGNDALAELVTRPDAEEVIARALAANPQLLLLDEPFGALDAFTRDQMQTLLLKLWQETGKQVLLITHDIEEAVFMATELVLLSPGPGRVLERLPLNFARRFVAGESSRSIKSDPQFIAMREYVLSRVFEQREAFS